MNISRRLPALVLLVFSLALQLQAQEPEYKKYEWESSPKLHKISAYNKTFSEIILKENNIVEYIYDKNDLVCYILRHKIIKANTDEGVMRNNRIILPISDKSQMLITKARVINSKGEVKELQQSDIKVDEDKESKTTYHYFALEGLDVGSEIEYIFAYKQNADYYGRRYTLQDESPKENVEFSIYTPSNLLFASKSFNGLPDLQASVTKDEKNKLSVMVDSIPGVKEEEFATYSPNLMQLVYKLNENKSSDKKNIINYNEATQNVGNIIHEPLSKQVTKDLDKFIKKINLSAPDNQEKTAREVEDYIKKNVAVEEHVDDNYETIQAILEYKSTSKMGITKLFAAIFDQLNIPYEIVLTTNRYEERFDPKFEAYNFLDEYFIYLSGINKYLCPWAPGFRLGLMPYQYFNNYGLFIKSVSIGEFKSNIGEVKFIEPTAFDATQHNHIISVDFSKSLDNPTFNYKLVLQGYYAQPMQPYYSYTTPDQQKDLDDLILKNMLPGINIASYNIENKGVEFLCEKPFIINATSNSSEMIDKAGNKYLFKLGTLIGPQVEMYQEKERVFDVENDYNRSYYREITFTLPADYKVSNPEVLNMNVEMKTDGKPSSYFVSTYEVKENTYVVKVHEDYKAIYYPKARFQEYRKVINAAADFNKIVLILEKKEK
jgi:hypothetical protein